MLTNWPGLKWLHVRRCQNLTVDCFENQTCFFCTSKFKTIKKGVTEILFVENLFKCQKHGVIEVLSSCHGNKTNL